MSDGDEESAEGAEGELEAASFDDALEAVTAPLEEPDADGLNEAFDAAGQAIDAAETEADLDEVEGALGEVESALEAAELPEPEDDEADPREALEGRLEDARAALEDARGPYASDVVDSIAATVGTVHDTRWTEAGETELLEPVAAFLETAADQLDADLGAAEESTAALAEALEAAVEAIEAADLDPDADADAIATLLTAADELSDGVDAAESWDDLSTREKLEAEGFFDVLDHRKDYPPEWAALKEWEKRGNAEMVLLALEQLGSDFMEEHALDVLRRLGDEAAIDAMLERADRRDKDAIEILGKIGSEAAVETIVEYADPDSDVGLQQITLNALGEIGSRESTQVVADRLAADNEEVRSAAARALGCIGDPRAIDPLADRLAEDESSTVRGAAAWALVQIGTGAALEAAAEYTDDRAYLVQAEAEAAADALGAQTA
ncbi:MAG: HEAT repeat domain-containing protein [Halobacteriales archaeon]